MLQLIAAALPPGRWVRHPEQWSSRRAETETDRQPHQQKADISEVQAGRSTIQTARKQFVWGPFFVFVCLFFTVFILFWGFGCFVLWFLVFFGVCCCYFWIPLVFLRRLHSFSLKNIDSGRFWGRFLFLFLFIYFFCNFCDFLINFMIS